MPGMMYLGEKNAVDRPECHGSYKWCRVDDGQTAEKTLLIVYRFKFHQIAHICMHGAGVWKSEIECKWHFGWNTRKLDGRKRRETRGSLVLRGGYLSLSNGQPAISGYIQTWILMAWGFDMLHGFRFKWSTAFILSLLWGYFRFCCGSDLKSICCIHQTE